MSQELMHVAGGCAVRQLVGFTVEKEEFAVDILKVQEIIRMVEITKMPNAPHWVEGVINLRGKVIPVIDFRRRFNISGEEYGDAQSRRIMVITLKSITVGIVVDKVSEVLKLTDDHISPAPEATSSCESECISGIGMVDGKLLILLDLERMYPQNDFDSETLAA